VRSDFPAAILLKEYSKSGRTDVVFQRTPMRIKNDDENMKGVDRFGQTVAVETRKGMMTANSYSGW